MSILTPVADRDTAVLYPGKQIYVREPDDDYDAFYLQEPYSVDWYALRVKPDVAILRAPQMDLFLQTNAYGLLGPEVDFSRRLTAIWGDSIVAGYGRGWIEGMSDRIPGWQILNGGLMGARIQAFGTNALEKNAILPIERNVILPGWRTMFFPEPAVKVIYAWLNHLIDQLPNVILCTQPTSLNEKVIRQDFQRWQVGTGMFPPYRAGYTLWQSLPCDSEHAQALYKTILLQNEIVHRVARERLERNGQRIPVIDLFRRFYTGDAADFREKFIDAGHFRIEAYPTLQEVFLRELAPHLA